MNSENTLLATAFGEFQLQRFPKTSDKSPLRAWDAADLYLLDHLHELELKTDAQILLLNDQFGALGLSLHVWQPQSVSDSYLCQQGCRDNLAANNLPESSLELLNSLEQPQGEFDCVVIKIPKTLALLEDQLYTLRRHIHQGTRIIAAGMVKEIHTSTLQLFERILGPTTTSLAKKKARLIFCEPSPDDWQGESPYPSRYTLAETGWSLSNHANVFSRAKLDIGTRFFMEHIGQLPPAKDIVDLGCGNGLLGLLAGDRLKDANIHFYDESHMALASARENCERILEAPQRCHFNLDNCLSQAPSLSADLVLNNPPFHQKNVVGDHIAWQMFKDSKRVLRPGGEIWVIGNRHLQYHAKLKKLFGNCRTVASNKKFVLLAATKR